MENLTKCGQSLSNSVTRFGEIMTIWQNFTSLWQFFNSLFLILKNDGRTLANLEHYLANFHCCYSSNIGK